MKTAGKFVIQKHTRQDCVHWDLMLETAEVLQTYRLESPPKKLLEQACCAVKIFDHPLKFLSYEGSVNNGKGSVRIDEAGTYQLLSKNERCFKLRLGGKILKGKFALTHIEDEKWEFGRY